MAGTKHNEYKLTQIRNLRIAFILFSELYSFFKKRESFVYRKNSLLLSYSTNVMI